MHNVEVIKNCVGCKNCENICPTSAITMKDNKEGFWYPNINKDKCIECGKCINICPEYGCIEKQYPQKTYIAISKDKILYKKAASGGAFSAIAKYCFETYNDVAVVGCTYEKGIVHHVMIDKVSKLPKLQGSKYVQSDLNNIVILIQSLLRNGKFVLFSGTPCQVAAVKKFIPENIAGNLLCIDLVCHGTPSPKFLKKDIQLWTDGNAAKDLSFRKKSKFQKSKSEYFLTITCDSKKIHTCSYKSDPYYNLFMKGLTFRESCYKCQYACLKRVGDITVGDCDSANLYEFHRNMATSLILVNSDKGMKVLSGCDSYLNKMEIDLSKEAEVNHQLLSPSNRPKDRDNIYSVLNHKDMKVLVDLYARKKSFRDKINMMVFDFLPRSFIRAATRMMNRKK